MEEYMRWEDNIKMDLKEIGADMMSWVQLPQVKYHWKKLVNEAFKLKIPKAKKLVSYLF